MPPGFMFLSIAAIYLGLVRGASLSMVMPRHWAIALTRGTGALIAVFLISWLNPVVTFAAGSDANGHEVIFIILMGACLVWHVHSVLRAFRPRPPSTPRR